MDPMLQTMLKHKDIKELQKTFQQSQAYAKEKMDIHLLEGGLSLIETMLYLSTGLLHWTWSYAASFGGGEIKTSAIFTILNLFTSLPLERAFSYYKTFVLEEKYGFNKTTKQTWIMDKVKSMALTIILGLPLQSLFIWLIRSMGRSFVPRVSVILFALQIAFIPIGIYIIAPIFNSYKPIADFPKYAPFYPRIQKLAETLKFPLGKVWIMDGSKRSSHSNAFFIGLPFLTQQIVIYDTLLDTATEDAAEAILAHELGHWWHHDSLVMMAINQCVIVSNLLLINQFLFDQSLYRQFGFDTEPLMIGFFLISQLLSPFDSLLSSFIHSLQRQIEFRADQFALRHGYAAGLKEGLITLLLENKSLSENDALYSAMRYSHPTVVERLKRLDDLTSTR